MVKPSVLLLVALLILLASLAKGQEVMPLHKFFQQNFDSTIVYQYSSNRNRSPTYLILAKHQGQLAFFTYFSPYSSALGHYFPGKLSQKFAEEEHRFRTTVPDTNRYFLPHMVSSEALSSNWRLLNPRRLWKMQGDEQLPKAANQCLLEDGEDNTFYLITRKTIRVTRFYAPDFYEQCAGANTNRQMAIGARNQLRILLTAAR